MTAVPAAKLLETTIAGLCKEELFTSFRQIVYCRIVQTVCNLKADMTGHGVEAAYHSAMSQV